MFFKNTFNYLLGLTFITLLVCYPARNSFSEEVLLFDDFDGPGLDTSIWAIGTWNIGSKSQFGHTPEFYNENGTTFASLIMDTYNPNSPGARVLGSEIWSLEKFDVGGGVEFEARVRALDITGGQICSFFTYDRYRKGRNWLSDEIDLEIVTNEPTDTVLFTSWNDWVEGSNDYGDGVHHLGIFISIDGYDYQEWNTYQIHWYPDRVEWYVNTALVNTHTSPVPDRAMPVRANFWAAGPEWTDAYDPNLEPTSNPAANQRYYYDIDYIKVTRLGNTPAAPTNLSASVDGDTVTLSWQDNSNDENGFEVHRAAKPKGRSAPAYSTIGTTNADDNDYVDTPGNGSWLYKVNAYNNDGTSYDSNEVQVSIGSPGKGSGGKNK